MTMKVRVKKVTLLIPEQMYEQIKQLVEEGKYSSISEVVRSALRLLLSQEKH